MANGTGAFDRCVELAHTDHAAAARIAVFMLRNGGRPW